MRKFIAILTLLLTSIHCYANVIDKLKTVREAEQFFWQQNGGERDSVSSFLVADIDNNGLTDLLIDMKKLQCAYAILDTGSGYNILRIDTRGSKYKLVNIITTNNPPLLVVNNTNYECYMEKHNDTLIFKFGYFIEYSAPLIKSGIKEIHLEFTEMEFGTPIFVLHIDSTRWATYQNSDYGGTERMRRYRISAGEINKEYFENIKYTIDYINIISFPDKYRPGWPPCWTFNYSFMKLRIQFDDGRIKDVIDYDGTCTLGLQNLYMQLLNAAKSLPELR